jgi:type III restriction enzyme
MQLKQYQINARDTLRDFLEAATISGPKAAYESLTGEHDLKERLRGFAGDYVPVNGIEDTPYVCLRLPTGGGKTILAAHAIDVARKSWMGKDYPMVLWMVSSNQIQTQTLDALKKPRHPYRKALDEQFGGNVRVFAMEDFTQIPPQDLESKCCIIVGTIQTLRITDTDKRKIYSHHEMLEPHFTRLNLHAYPGLEAISDTNPGKRFSFANLLHVHQPLMIVDEAHNAVTGLSEEMHRRVNPSAIIEFTATPQS